MKKVRDMRQTTKEMIVNEESFLYCSLGYADVSGYCCFNFLGFP